MKAALGRKEQKKRHRKVTGDVEARICAIVCSTPPEGASRWTMQAIAEELIRLEVVDYITESTVCNVMKKTKLNRGLCKAFSAEEANRLTKRFERHYTPKHGSWLDMAEIEIGVMSRQALAKPFPDLESFAKQVRNWTIKRNARRVKIN